MNSYRLEARKADGTCIKRGTAWAIDEELIVTAFHVVADGTGKWLHEIADIRYWLMCGGAPTGIALEKVSCDSDADVALLRLASRAAGRPGPSLQTLPIGEWGAAVGSGWSAPGYPSLAGDAQVTLTGTIKAVRLGPGGDVFELHVAEGSAESWAGASGSPLHVNGRVVAMIVTELPGAATQDAVSVQRALSLWRLAESATLQVGFHNLVEAGPRALLEALAANWPEYDESEAPHSLVEAVVAHGTAYGVRGMLKILEQLPDTHERRTYTSELLISTFGPDLTDWPRKPLIDDRKWDRHADNAIPPSLQLAWTSFVATESWETSLSLMMDQLKGALEAVSLSRGLAQRLKTLNFAAPFGQLCVELLELLDSIEGEIDLAIPEQSGRSARKAIAQLRWHIHRGTPRGRCFFVMGSSGTGKTHFLEWLVKRPKQAALVVTVAWPTTTVLTAALLEGEIMAVLLRATGRKFATLTQFQEALDRFENSWAIYCDGHFRSSGRQRPILVIAFDNMQTVLSGPQSASAACAALQALIEDATRYNSVRWLFMLQHTFFDRLTMPADGPSFWSEYGWIDDDAPAQAAPTTSFAKAGWIDLDRICVHDGVGQAILSQAFGAEWNKATLLDDDSVRAASLRNGMLQRYMALPWFSWVLASMGEQWCIGVLQSGDLNHIRIVKELHKKKVAPLNESDTMRMQLGRYVRAVAAAMLPGDGSRPRDNSFDRDVAARCVEAKMPFVDDQLFDALDQLIGSSLMKQIAEFQIQLELEFVMLWGYEGAKYLQQVLAGKDRDTITERLCTDLASAAEDRLMLKESVLEFLLMIADQNCASGMIEAIVALAPHGLGDSAAAILFAAPKLGRSTQQLIARFDVEPGVIDDASMPSRRLLLARMMFAEWADPAAFTPAERLDFMRTQYRNIRAVGFASYYRAVAYAILDDVADVVALCPCLLSLNGCERAGLAEPLARRVVERLFDLARKTESGIDPLHTVIETVRLYAIDSLDCAKEDYQARKAPRRDETVPGESHSQSGSSGDREFFREWVLHYVCTWVVKALEPVPAFLAFRRSGWFEVGGKGDLHIEMEREATLAIGHYFHGDQRLFEEGRRGVGAKFKELIRDLVDAVDPDTRKLAFHLMFHTEPTGGRNEHCIHHSFIPMLESLATDRKLAAMKRFRSLYTNTVKRDLPKPRKPRRR